MRQRRSHAVFTDALSLSSLSAVDLVSIAEIVTRTSYATVDPPPALTRAESSGNTLRTSQSVNGGRRLEPSELSFSLLSSGGTSLLECVRHPVR